MAASEVVVITGASAGIGRATAVAFARRGAKLALLARGAERLESARREVEAAGGTALPIPTDVADPDQVERAAERAERVLGPIDVWVNSAMVTVFSPLAAMTAAEFHRVTAVTYLGCVHGTLAALRRMRDRRRGTIVQVGSALAYRAIPLQSAYCGAKFAIRGFTDALRSELIHERSPIQVTMVQLAAFNTPQFDWARTHIPRNPQPVPPIFQPEVAARAIVWAAHHRRRELWVGWPAVQAILANRLMPGLLDRYLASRAYSGQFTEEPLSTDRPDNLFQPVPGDFGSHGRFDGRARSRSWQLSFTLHRHWIAAALAGVLALGVFGAAF
ncbi:SDR family oxidoreductase [Candidatus Methylocalor cossyra]|uniref:Short-subunit dehydrogenase n=1 Tax=Candidatus Methylocalor cossyra TaxID=3108543 RepID=A0ABM9NMJ9_9GAMM